MKLQWQAVGYFFNHTSLIWWGDHVSLLNHWQCIGSDYVWYFACGRDLFSCCFSNIAHPPVIWCICSINLIKILLKSLVFRMSLIFRSWVVHKTYHSWGVWVDTQRHTTMHNSIGSHLWLPITVWLKSPQTVCQAKWAAVRCAAESVIFDLIPIPI